MTEATIEPRTGAGRRYLMGTILGKRGVARAVVAIENEAVGGELQERLERVLTNVTVGTWYDAPSEDVAVAAVSRLHTAEERMWELLDYLGIDPGDSWIRPSQPITTGDQP